MMLSIGVVAAAIRASFGSWARARARALTVGWCSAAALYSSWVRTVIGRQNAQQTEGVRQSQVFSFRT
jgi:hypothetical protein